MPITNFDEIEARLIRIEESIQIGDCPPLDTCIPHPDIVDEVQKHLPKIHGSAGEHSDGGRDPLVDIATQSSDIIVEKIGPRYVLSTGLATDPFMWAWTVSDLGDEVFLQFFAEPSGPWITVATWDKAGNFNADGGITVDDGDLRVEGDPPCLVWHRSTDSDEYRLCATSLGLEIESRPTGTGLWQKRITIPRDGWTQGSLLAGNATGGLEELPIGPVGFGLAADPGSPLGLSYSSFGTPTSQAPGIVPIGCWMPYGGDSDPGLQPDNSSYMICDGRVLLETNFPELFAIIGFNFGGSGSSFNIPDMTDRVPVQIGAVVAAIGDVVGGTDHQHAVVEVPLHGHTSPAHSHTSPAHTHSNSAHSHPGSTGSSHSHGFSVPAHTHTVSDSGHSHGGSVGNHTHSVNDGTHDHGVGSYSVENHSHDSGSLITSGQGESDVAGAGTGVPRTNGGSFQVSIDGDTGNANPGLNGRSSSNIANISINSTAPSLSIDAATTGVSVNSGGGFSGNTEADTPGVNVASQSVVIDVAAVSIDTTVVSIADAGQSDAATELSSSIQPSLGCNYAIRVL